MNNIDSRIAVLEKLSEHCEAQREDLNLRVQVLQDKFDEHLAANTKMHAEVSKAVLQLSVSLDHFSKTVERLIPAADLALKHEAMGSAIIKGGSIVAAIAAAAWSVFTFFA